MHGPESTKVERDLTYFAKGVEMEGIAKLEGVVRIDGHFSGAINTKDMLIVGEHAVIRGSITADEIISSGKIIANLTANKRIQLLYPAVLIGDVNTPSLSMEEGVCFQGICDMGINEKNEWLEQESQDSKINPTIIEHGELVTTQ